MSDNEKTLEEIEAEIAEIEAKVRRVRAKAPKKTAPKVDPATRPKRTMATGTGEDDGEGPAPKERNRIGHTTAALKSSHGGLAGRTIIERIEEQMDKRKKAMDASEKQANYAINQGRYEGLALALALLRSSNLTKEYRRSEDRLKESW